MERRFSGHWLRADLEDINLTSYQPEVYSMSVAQAPTAAIKSMVVTSTGFGPREIEEITRAISENYANYRELREGVQEDRRASLPRRGVPSAGRAAAHLAW